MEPLKEILYVSQSMIPRGSADSVLTEIVGAALIKNRALGISGSLIFSGHRFAQCLQGEAKAVDALMETIAADSRHTHVSIVVDRAIDRRSYSGWGLNYAGPSLYVDRHLKAVVQSAGGARDERAIQRLSELMLELAREEAPE